MSINTRGVTELVHFTSNHGVLGALYTKYVKSRSRLEGDPLVEYLFKPNSAFRKDVAYLDHVSLSFDNINRHYYRTSAEGWHKNKDVFWVILSFDTSIMDHFGVEFATTNNIYTGVKRGSGAQGYTAMFDSEIVHWHGKHIIRPDELPHAWPTCEQAELLYPGEISTQYLRRIYTRTAEEQSEVIGFVKGSLHDHIEVAVDPQRFEGHRQ